MGSLFPAAMSNVLAGHKECLCAALLNSLPNWIGKDTFFVQNKYSEQVQNTVSPELGRLSG